MGVYGEVAKFLWFLCDSIKEEPDACYIMASEFAMVGVPIIMIMEPEWTFKKAQVCAFLWRLVVANLCTRQRLCCKDTSVLKPGPCCVVCANADARCGSSMHAQ